MPLLSQIVFDVYFPREYLKAAVLVCLLSVWVLVGLFFYLNLYTRRRYFTIWTVAWLFYALWITLNFGLYGEQRPHPLLLMVEQWCVGVAAVFLLWGSQTFLGVRVRHAIFGWFIAFLLVWSYAGAYHLDSMLQLRVPIFALIGLASVMTARSFLKYRRASGYVGATLLALGFLLWGAYMAGFPFLEHWSDLISVALFLSAAIQLFVAVSMIILVLEEVRHTHEQAVEQIETTSRQSAALQTKVASTEERYRSLFEQAAEAIVITRADDFQILELNPAAERLLGIERAESGRHALTRFCHLAGQTGETPAQDGWFQRVCRERRLHLIRKDGSAVSVEVGGTRIDFDGQPACQFFLRELTERARLEQQLRQSEKLSALGQMISGIAHELNNPLTVVKGYLELILAHHDLSPQTRADLQKVAHESDRAAKLVRNFLAFAREQPARREALDFNELVHRVAELRKFDLIVARVDLQLELCPDLPKTTAAPDQVQQVLINLMNNAVQAVAELPRRGVVKVRTEHCDGFIHVSVEDNGPGVPPELVSRIFEPFFTTKEVGTGTGLGLSIAHSIMTEHKGRMYYQDSSLGGAAFVLEFPVTELPAEAAQSAMADDAPGWSAPAAQSPPGNILVLDDEKAIAEMLGEMLALLGHKPTLCHSATHALHLIDDHRFDLIISDFRMPGLNGQQFYERAVAKQPELAPRIVFLTGDVVNEETQMFLRSIGNPHLAKPFNLDGVKKIVADLLRVERV